MVGREEAGGEEDEAEQGEGRGGAAPWPMGTDTFSRTASPLFDGYLPGGPAPHDPSPGGGPPSSGLPSSGLPGSPLPHDPPPANGDVAADWDDIERLPLVGPAK